MAPGGAPGLQTSRGSAPVLGGLIPTHSRQFLDRFILPTGFGNLSFCLETGRLVPEPVSNEYSGHLRIRIPKSL